VSSRLVRATGPLVVAASTAVAAPAIAAPRSEPTEARAPTDTRALVLFEQSARAYREGRFQEAVDLLLEARRLKAEPVLLYDLGRAYEALGRPGDAADAYAKYLDEDPNAADRKAIEGRIATLRAQASELEAARQKPVVEPPPPAPPKETPRDEGDGLGAVPWIVAGAGVAAIGTGIVLGNVARSKHDDAVAERAQADAAAKQDRAESLGRAATITIIGGGVVAALGIAWIAVRAMQSPTSARARPAPAFLGGTF
jgi:tetratricopeptide (TPR) repeat protein